MSMSSGVQVMLGKILAAVTALGTALAINATAPALADGMPAAPQVKKTVKYNPRYHVGYHYVRGQWPGGPDPYAYSYGKQGLLSLLQFRLVGPPQADAGSLEVSIPHPGILLVMGLPGRVQGTRPTQLRRTFRLARGRPAPLL